MQLPYLTSTELAAITEATERIERNFRFLRYATWWSGWDDIPSMHAALRCYYNEHEELGQRHLQQCLLAMSKLRSVIPEQDRMLLLATIPARQIGGSIVRIGRVYAETNGIGRIGGSWTSTDNEVVAAMLSVTQLQGRTAFLPEREFRSFITNVRAQLAGQLAGTCRCGIRQTKDTCYVCGARGKV